MAAGASSCEVDDIRLSAEGQWIEKGNDGTTIQETKGPRSPFKE